MLEYHALYMSAMLLVLGAMSQSLWSVPLAWVIVTWYLVFKLLERRASLGWPRFFVNQAILIALCSVAFAYIASIPAEHRLPRILSRAMGEQHPVNAK